MEQFGASKSTPLATCISEVEQSDIYVGIIGMRYGSEEPNSGKSYSQLEYEKAVEQNKEILIYLIDEESSSKPAHNKKTNANFYLGFIASYESLCVNEQLKDANNNRN